MTHPEEVLRIRPTRGRALVKMLPAEKQLANSIIVQPDRHYRYREATRALVVRLPEPFESTRRVDRGDGKMMTVRFADYLDTSTTVYLDAGLGPETGTPVYEQGEVRYHMISIDDIAGPVERE